MRAIERQLLHQDWVIFILLLALTLLTVTKYHKPRFLFGYFVAFFVQGFIKKQVENRIPSFSIFNIFMFFFSGIVVSLSVSFIIYQNKLLVHQFLEVLFAIYSYMFLRNLIDFLIGLVIEPNEDLYYFRKSKFTYFMTVGLWLFPILIIYQYSFKNSYLLIAMFLLFELIRMFLIILNNKNLIFKNLFYFILYLCTLEIAPLLILYKLTLA